MVDGLHASDTSDRSDRSFPLEDLLGSFSLGGWLVRCLVDWLDGMVDILHASDTSDISR